MSDENDEQYTDDNADNTDNADDNSGSEDSTDSQDVAGAMANASPAEVEAHRGVLGGVIDQLQANGINVEDLAEKAGVSSADVDALTHDDLLTLAIYVQEHHPEVMQMVAERFPAAEGLLGLIGAGGGGGGAVGGLLGRFLGGGQ